MNKKSQMSTLAGNKLVLILLLLMFLIVIIIWISNMKGDITEVITRFFS